MKNSKILLAGLMLLLPAFAAAQDEAPEKKTRKKAPIKLAKEDESHPCVPDMHKYCEHVYNASRMEQGACLQEHNAELSAPCKKEMGLIVEVTTEEYIKKDAAKKSRGGITGDHACMSDLEEFCPEYKGKPGKDVKCLMSFRDELSQECKARLRKDAAKKRRKAVKAAPKKVETEEESPRE